MDDMLLMEVTDCLDKLEPEILDLFYFNTLWGFLLLFDELVEVLTVDVFHDYVVLVELFNLLIDQVLVMNDIAMFQLFANDVFRMRFVEEFMWCFFIVTGFSQFRSIRPFFAFDATQMDLSLSISEFLLNQYG